MRSIINIVDSARPEAATGNKKPVTASFILDNFELYYIMTFQTVID